MLALTALKDLIDDLVSIRGSHDCPFALAHDITLIVCTLRVGSLSMFAPNTVVCDSEILFEFYLVLQKERKYLCCCRFAVVFMAFLYSINELSDSNGSAGLTD